VGLSASKPINNNGRICWDSPPAVDQPACMAVIAMTEKEVRHPREQQGGLREVRFNNQCILFFLIYLGPAARRLSLTPRMKLHDSSPLPARRAALQLLVHPPSAQHTLTVIPAQAGIQYCQQRTTLLKPVVLAMSAR